MERRMRPYRGAVLGMVFQEPQQSLSPYFSVFSQAQATLRRHQAEVTKDQVAEKATRLLERMQFGNPSRILSLYPHELSGGQAQRVAIMLALLPDPALLIADEPTTALDAVTSYEVLTLLDELIDERQTALLMVSHDLRVIRKMARRVYVMRHGAVVDACATTVLRDGALDSRDPYTQLLVRAAA
jgi:ABC-type dipeptide/oligopeptide/nickel transport system ATPase component